MAQMTCRHFNGYKPCAYNDRCNDACPTYSVPSVHILVVHLEALGAVLRATSLLPAIHRKFPGCHITWVTKAPAHAFFAQQPLVHRVLTTNSEDLQQLKALEFEVGYAIDKSALASAILDSCQVDIKYGFYVDPLAQAILPRTNEADYLWQLGLDNHEKFLVNKKPETHLMCDALGLPFARDEYQVTLSASEQSLLQLRRELWSGASGRILIGINTGCSSVIPYKKWSFSGLVKLLQHLSSHPRWQIVLLGGPEDSLRNRRVADLFPGIIESPTDLGLRDGLVSVGACDIVVTGDSLGMHMAIALKKWVVAWFGPTCAHEIDLYGRGEAILSSAKCGPCWRRSCQEPVMCYDQLDFSSIYDAICKGESWYQNQSSSFRPPSLEISS